MEMTDGMLIAKADCEYERRIAAMILNSIQNEEK
jgi:hypothetical protein